MQNILISACKFSQHGEREWESTDHIATSANDFALMPGIWLWDASTTAIEYCSHFENLSSHTIRSEHVKSKLWFSLCYCYCWWCWSCEKGFSWSLDNVAAVKSSKSTFHIVSTCELNACFQTSKSSIPLTLSLSLPPSST